VRKDGVKLLDMKLCSAEPTHRHTVERKEGRRTENRWKKKKNNNKNNKKNSYKNITVCVYYGTWSSCLHIVAINEKHPSCSSTGTRCWRWQATSI